MENSIFNLSSYDYTLPPELIAQEPLEVRDSARLLVIDRAQSLIKKGLFSDILTMLRPGDVLVLNNTKVIKAKLLGRKRTGAVIDVLLVKERAPGVWEVLANPGKRCRRGDIIIFGSGEVTAHVIDTTVSGGRVLEFSHPNILSLLERIGQPPLPHYIKKDLHDAQKYQTLYAAIEGAIAAPTAGFHFTLPLLDALCAKGIRIVYVTLHCGPATFRPVKTADIREHHIDSEWIQISESAAEAINNAKKANRRIVAVGTTSIRTLESVATASVDGRFRVRSYCGPTQLYITPGYAFKIIDAAVTNFHTPCSTNLILAASFAGFDLLMAAYRFAIAENFRFFSFGDATIII
ncbi:MAG: tRNA preQ1(34) S-adenosylmethionine ribosyltransferase-isomerase QueA [Candidatus Omnitrophota bacterium]